MNPAVVAWRYSCGLLKKVFPLLRWIESRLRKTIPAVNMFYVHKVPTSYRRVLYSIPCYLYHVFSTLRVVSNTQKNDYKDCELLM